jgi:hypothetical protein
MNKTIWSSKWILLSTVFVFSLALIPLLLPPAYAVQPPVSAGAPLIEIPEGSQPIKVGFYILNVGNLDMTTGNYTMDFFLNFECGSGCDSATFDPDTFDIMNGQITDKEDQTSDDADGNWRAYRVRASLITNLDVRDYPFDQHRLVIEMEDKVNNIGKIHYVVDEKQSGVDSSAVVSGWQLKGTPEFWSAEVVEHPYPVFDSIYSRYRFYVTIYHPWQSSFLKGLFAPIVIVLVGLLAVLMNEEKISDRLALTTSALVGAILYHLSVISSIPPVGYLTYMDKFMLVNYLVIALALGVTVLMMVYQDNGQPERARQLNLLTRGLIPLAWVVLITFITVTQFLI